MNYDDYTAEKGELENPLSVFSYFCLFFVLSTVMMGMIIGLAQNGLQVEIFYHDFTPKMSFDV